MAVAQQRSGAAGGMILIDRMSARVRVRICHPFYNVRLISYDDRIEE